MASLDSRRNSRGVPYQFWTMVNTRIGADLSAAVQNALQTLLPHIRVEIREEFRTSSGPSDFGGNSPPVTIHTWLERFNKKKPRSFEKATAPGNALAWWKAYKQAKGGDAWLITVTWAEFKKLFFLQFFPRAEQERLKREYHSIRQTNTETSTEFMQSTLNHLMCTPFTDVAQVANAARNYEFLHERDDDDAERPDKRQKSGFQQSRGPSEGYSYPVCTTCGSRHQESIVELLVPASSVAKMAICRRIARRTPLRVHLVRLIRSQFDDKIRTINALPLDMCEFDIILGMDWLTEHHATIDCRSYRVIFGDIHAPEFIYHGSLPGKSMQIIFALQACTLLSYGCEGFLANIHDTTSDVPSIHDQPIVFEFPDVFPDELPGIPPVPKLLNT
nr:hypothetical protein [Tanacetum cinerariifolium]